MTGLLDDEAWSVGPRVSDLDAVSSAEYKHKEFSEVNAGAEA